MPAARIFYNKSAAALLLCSSDQGTLRCASCQARRWRGGARIFGAGTHVPRPLRLRRVCLLVYILTSCWARDVTSLRSAPGGAFLPRLLRPTSVAAGATSTAAAWPLTHAAARFCRIFWPADAKRGMRGVHRCAWCLDEHLRAFSRGCRYGFSSAAARDMRNRKASVDWRARWAERRGDRSRASNITPWFCLALSGVDLPFSLPRTIHRRRALCTLRCGHPRGTRTAVHIYASRTSPPASTAAARRSGSFDTGPAFLCWWWLGRKMVLSRHGAASSLRFQALGGGRDDMVHLPLAAPRRRCAISPHRLVGVCAIAERINAQALPATRGIALPHYATTTRTGSCLCCWRSGSAAAWQPARTRFPCARMRGAGHALCLPATRSPRSGRWRGVEGRCRVGLEELHRVAAARLI